MRLKKRLKIVMWKVYYLFVDIIRVLKNINSDSLNSICDKENGIKIIRNDLLIKVLQKKRKEVT